MKSKVRRWLPRLLLATGTGAALLVVWLWFTLLSPWGYAPPQDLPPIEQQQTHRVFAYGTLRYQGVRWLVTGRSTPAKSATLHGFRKEGLDLVPQAGARTHGKVFEVDAETLRRLDRYERLGVRYQRSRLTLDSGATAWVYRRRDSD